MMTVCSSEKSDCPRNSQRYNTEDGAIQLDSLFGYPYVSGPTTQIGVHKCQVVYEEGSESISWRTGSGWLLEWNGDI
jgi:hypothetical protein